MTDVLLATFSGLPEGEERRGTHYLTDTFASRGIDARWAVWDDPTVDWSGSLVAVRSTWDYAERLEEFLTWARSLPRLLNGVDVFEWNTDKGYLAELAERGVAVVPTRVAATDDELAEAVARSRSGGSGGVVVKPRVGAGGVGVTVLGPSDPPDGSGDGPWVVQPLVEAVRTEGETSVYILDGQAVSQAQKVPASGEILVHPQYGGSTRAVELTEEATALARSAVAATEALLGHRLDYARVDAMRLADGTLALSELELTEPGLYLDVIPDNARVFAELVARRLEEES